jgi:hypothetical protein
VDWVGEEEVGWVSGPRGRLLLWLEATNGRHIRFFVPEHHRLLDCPSLAVGGREENTSVLSLAKGRKKAKL